MRFRRGTASSCKRTNKVQFVVAYHMCGEYISGMTDVTVVHRYDETTKTWTAKVPKSRDKASGHTFQQAKRRGAILAEEVHGEGTTVVHKLEFDRQTKKEVDSANAKAAKVAELFEEYTDHVNELLMARMKVAEKMATEFRLSQQEIADLLGWHKTRVKEVLDPADRLGKRARALISGEIERGSDEWYGTGRRGKRS